MRRPILARSVVTAAAAALLVAGCGGGATTTSSKDPKVAFSTGLSGLNDTDALTVTLKLDTTADALMGFAKESGDNTLDATVAKDIASAQLVIETKTLNGKNLSSIKPGQTDATATRFTFQDNGNSYAELRSVGNTLYIQADVKGLLDLFQQSKVYAEVQARAGSLPAFVKAFVGGKWVSLDGNLLKGLASQFGGANVSPNPAQTQKLLADLKAVIQRDVAVTRIGTDDQGDHLRLTAQSRQLATDLLQAVGAAVPAAGLILGKAHPSKIPAHSIVVDAWINNGALAKVSLDITQFFDPAKKKPGDTLPVILTFDPSGDDIAKPDGAVPVDLSQLGSLLGGLGA